MRNKKILIVFINLLILITCVGCNKKEELKEVKEENKIIIESSDQMIATMYYSYMIGQDAGTEYTIVIYDNHSNTYKYEIIRSEITIRGSEKKEQIETGLLKDSNNLKELDKTYQNKKVNNVEIYNSLYSYQNEENKEISSIDELSKILFK